mmetsp:Transcript_5548/g.15485  ORF Transcript_5548/g.15485 Transcript_5548/m.15485 type:complete len:641 (+) Transcript_5548:154-2076(+)
MGPRLQRPSQRRARPNSDDTHRDGNAALSFGWGAQDERPRPVSRWNARRLFASISVNEGVSKLMEAVKSGSAEWRPRLNLPSLPMWVQVTPSGHPTKSRLMTVQDFFKYTQLEGERFFEELDSDRDGRVTLADVRAAMRRRNLPAEYARDFMNRARRNRWWISSVGWEDVKLLMDEREADMLKAFTILELAPDGHLELSGIKGSLQRMGLPATDENAVSMFRALETSPDDLISYGKFRNFLILLPDERIQSDLDPAFTWFESATMVPFAPPHPQNTTAKVVITAALAGAVASGSSTFVLHPLDTLKTRLQASVGGNGIMDIVKRIPEIGAVQLYRGIVPATVGAASAHGIRTGAQELTLKLLQATTGGALELQATGLASAVGTLLGTACRIPCEVLKQRLQVGAHRNVGEALAAATKVQGVRGLFQGTAATLGREVPFYVLGVVGYEQLKKLFNGEMLGGPGAARELTSAQTIAIGALSGALAAVLTTPADVMKTRIMTLPAGKSFVFGTMVLEIAQKEGFGAFFKGCIPRGLWIAPVGAMNFAGYELAKKAMLAEPGNTPDPAAAAAATQTHILPATQATGTTSTASRGRTEDRISSFSSVPAGSPNSTDSAGATEYPAEKLTPGPKTGSAEDGGKGMD